MRQAKRTLNKDLDAVSRLITIEPRRVRNRNADLAQVAVRKAQGVLELQNWVATPLDENTYSCFRDRIMDDAATYVQIGWHALPDPTQDVGAFARRRSLRDIGLWILVSVAGAAMVVLAVIFSDRLGLAAQIATVAGLALLMLGLIRSGVPLAQVREGLDVLKEAQGLTGKRE